MDAVALSVQPRTATGKNASRRMRADGSVPAVVYGEGEANLNVQVRPAALVPLLKGKLGQNAVMRLDIDGQAGPTVMVRDYQIHPVRRTLVHVDFFRVKDDTMLVVEVPIEITGRAETEKAGGKRRVVTPTMKVRCKASQIPEAITYDVSHITGTEIIYVTDLQMPEGVEAVFRRTFPVVSITAPKVVAKAVEEDTKKKKK